MSLCNGNIIDLGYFRTCDTIATGLTAASTGTFKIRIASTDVTLDIDFDNNDAISFSNVFNDDAVHIFQILTPGGAVMDLNGSTCFRAEIRSRTYKDDSFSDAALGNCRGTSSGSSGSGLTRSEFTTNGSGAATVATFIGKTGADVWVYENGIQGVLVSEEDYTFTSATGIFTGLSATRKYLAYAY